MNKKLTTLSLVELKDIVEPSALYKIIRYMRVCMYT